MKLGKLQQMWVDSLRKHPERQTANFLGKGNPKDYLACCLGEALLCIYRSRKKKLPFFNSFIIDISNTKLLESYLEIGLHNSLGSFLHLIKYKEKHYESLAGLNDSGVSWIEIADIIEKEKDNLFTRSV